MGKQYYQKICLNGHQVTDHYSSSNNPNPPEFCELCGEKVIVTCPNCEQAILGDRDIDGVITVGFTKSVPNYCKSCGTPFPWTQKILEGAAELVALDDGLSDQDKQLIESAIPDLLVDTPKTKVAEAKFSKGYSKASKLVKDSLYNLLVDVLSETVKKTIFN
ncbi:DUF2321 domain-containing protein [Enterococcus gilvus]|uniref:DUF2321 domain-containing protein n=1 Tax=Enterococcus gilvus ATCC BAA-350 TaxID=1158614 RepID=R2V6N4_9ENTE|nr:DUF2321 domain-containing protein [Enterococcus gilvus]EOI53405.1 hypothetical protein UKC_03357 [Enterococcus gilvus ATCC BAA-350]EOI57310.1 hypothetical protein UKC_01524 [Enterococcus gilvus ATCC BAA-350]EOW81320.1 hypothetical protein I592_00605 [Enterococcus gilvus ATCC BAA-350]EOW83116.1 hypothetical protein I592_02443 [Enterococcus gilvus ATCC BAA-350]OJG37651.1 hypothetical protein RV02_GL003447 [Enterococcus gilvus]